MEQIGLVRKIDGDSMELEVRRISGCGGGCSSCGGGCDSPGHVIKVKNHLNAKVGDLVEIKGDSRHILKYTAIVYIIPLVFMVIGTIVGSIYFKSKSYSNYELYSLFSGLISMILSLFIVKRADKKIKEEGNKAIIATKIL